MFLFALSITVSRIPAEWLAILAAGPLQQVAEVPLTVHAIYWAFYIAMGTGMVKIYADLKQERKERVAAVEADRKERVEAAERYKQESTALVERVLQVTAAVADSLEAINERLTAESAAKRIEERLSQIESRLPNAPHKTS
jgi:hypothetical protein